MESAPAQPQPDAPAPNPRKPIRPLWLAVWLFSGCLVLAGILYALWPAYERSRWLKVKAAWDNRPGLRYAKPPKPRPPDDRNVAMHPLFRDCGVDGRKAHERLLAARPERPDPADAADGDAFGYLDLRGLQGKKGENLEDVARRLEAFFATDATLESDFDDAMTRPVCWWSGPPPPGQFKEDPQVDCLNALSERFQLRALSEGVLGHHDEALRSLLRIEQLATKTRADERTISALVAIASFRQFHACALHGLRMGWWDAEAREHIRQAVAAEMDGPGRISPALRIEMLDLADMAVFYGEKGEFHPGDIGVLGSIRGMANEIFAKVLPSTAFGYRFARGTYERCFPLASTDVVDWKMVLDWDNESGRLYDELDRPGAVLDLGKIIVPSPSRFMHSCFLVEAERRALLTFLAAERYRDAHGSYPPDAGTLSAELKSGWPLDPIDGKPIRYALRPDGFPKVWSVGGDVVDDGGKPGSKPYGDDGDWIWPPE